MAEEIEESLKQGFISWKNNLEIGVPYLLSTIITTILLVVSVLGVTLVAAAASAFTANMDSSIASFSVLAALCLSSLAALALTAALSAYFSAGAIGMSIEAVLNGRTTLSDMSYYGRKKWLVIFKANMLLAALLAIPGIILMLPPVYAFYSKAIPQGIALTIMATVVYLTYTIGLCFMYTLSSTAMIVDNAGVLQGIKSAGSYASRNKIRILVTVFSFMGTMSLASFFWSVLTSPLGLLQFLSPAVYGIADGLMILVFILIASFIITPLYTIWLTRIYMNKETKGARTARLPVSRHLNQEKPGTQRDVYV